MKAIATREEMRRQLVAGIKSGEIPMSDALKLIRKILKKNQTDFAKYVGVSRKVVVDFELRKGNPTLATFNKMFAPMGLEAGLRWIRQG